MEERMQELRDPDPGATFQYGINGRHSWIGHSPSDPERQMRYSEFVDVVGDFVIEHAPEVADTDSWRY